MLTSKQAGWVAHLSETEKVKVISFDPTCAEKFEKIKQKIQGELGEQIKVEHHGASNLGISGQDEIDIYVPVQGEKFDELVGLIQKIFGKPRSFYSMERARFVTEVDGKHVDIFVINEECDGWKDSLRFEKYLLEHAEMLDNYRKLKEKLSGESVREYYQRKIEFINEVLGRDGN